MSETLVHKVTQCPRHAFDGGVDRHFMEGGDDAELLVVFLPAEDDEAGDAEFAEKLFALALDVVVVDGGHEVKREGNG